MHDDDFDLDPAACHFHHVEPHLAPTSEQQGRGLGRVARRYPLILWGGLLLIWFLANFR